MGTASHGRAPAVDSVELFWDDRTKRFLIGKGGVMPTVRSSTKSTAHIRLVMPGVQQPLRLRLSRGRWLITGS